MGTDKDKSAIQEVNIKQVLNKRGLAQKTLTERLGGRDAADCSRR
jgi:hypothetical protein